MGLDPAILPIAALAVLVRPYYDSLLQQIWIFLTELFDTVMKQIESDPPPMDPEFDIADLIPNFMDGGTIPLFVAALILFCLISTLTNKLEKAARVRFMSAAKEKINRSRIRHCRCCGRRVFSPPRMRRRPVQQN